LRWWQVGQLGSREIKQRELDLELRRVERKRQQELDASNQQILVRSNVIIFRLRRETNDSSQYIVLFAIFLSRLLS
jgi:hypothetical protein